MAIANGNLAFQCLYNGSNFRKFLCAYTVILLRNILYLSFIIFYFIHKMTSYLSTLGFPNFEEEETQLLFRICFVAIVIVVSSRLWLQARSRLLSSK